MPLLRGRGTPATDVLLVCTGNVCRSPYLAARLGAALPGVRIASAGTAALQGHPLAAPVGELLTGRDIDTPSHVARPLTRADVRGARLILTAERRHRVEVETLVSSAADRTFTVKELARLLGPPRPLPGYGVDAVLERARRSLRRGGDDRDHGDDLADPYGRDAADYRTMAEEADDALRILVPALRPGATL